METAENLLDRFIDLIINPTIALIFTAGFFLFLWGLVVFLFKLGEGGAPSEGKQHMLWGLIGMLIMVSVYGILNIIENTFDLRSGDPDIGRMENIVPPINFGGR